MRRDKEPYEDEDCEIKQAYGEEEDNSAPLAGCERDVTRKDDKYGGEEE
jgi:hypothetical protein